MRKITGIKIYRSFSIFLLIPLLLISDKEANEKGINRDIYEAFIIRQAKDFLNMQGTDENKIVRHDHPDMAAFQDYLMTMDPATGEVPDYRLKKIRDYDFSKNYATDPGVENGLAWENVPADVGGRTRALMFDPLDPEFNKVWAGSVTGGLWFNMDITSDTSKWNAVDDIPAGTSISCLTCDPQNKEIFYAGTGEPQTAVTIYRGSSGVGQGIWRSTDSGDTWKLLSSTIDFAYVSDVAIRIENDTSVIYAAILSGYYEGEYHRSIPEDGLYRSKDNGETWEQVLPDIPLTKSTYAVSDIELTAGGRIFLGTMRNSDGLGAGVILCSDDGDNWSVYDEYRNVILSSPDSLSSNIPGRVMLASAPSDSNIIYSVFTGGGYTDANFLFIRAFGLLKSDDNGKSWNEVSMPSEDGSWAYIAWHALELEVNPSDPDIIYAGGLDLHRSMDGGNTWTNISYWHEYYGTPYVHADQHNIRFKPGSDKVFVVGNDGGVFYTHNARDTVPEFYERNKSYNTVQYYSCAIHPREGKDFYIGGTQDNGTFRYINNPVTVEDMISGGDGAFCFIDDDEPEYVITSVYYNRYYVFENGPGDILGTPNPIQDFYSGIFINPADYNAETNTLFANATTFEGYRKNEILVIRNMTSSPSGEFITPGTETTVPFSHVRVSDFSPAGESILYLGTQSGLLYKVENAETDHNVTEIGSAGFPTANISCVAEGDTENDLLVTFSNFGVSSVWLTEDGGLSWREVEGDLPDMPVRWALFYPGDPNSAILATEKGIWTTTDLDNQVVKWMPDQRGMGDVRIDMISLRKSDYDVLAATHGRGLSVTHSINLSNKAEHREYNTLDIWPNPAENGQFEIKFPAKGSADIIITGLDGKQIAKEYRVNLFGKAKINFNLANYTPGLYLITVKTGMKIYTGKIILK